MWIFHGYQNPVVAITHRLAAAGVIGGDDGAPRRAGFEQHTRNALAVMRRIDDQIRANQKRGHIRNAAQPFDGAALDHLLHLLRGYGAGVVRGFAARDEERGVDTLIVQKMRRRDKNIDALFMHKARGHKDDRRVVFGFGNIFEFLQIDARAAHKKRTVFVCELFCLHQGHVVGILKDKKCVICIQDKTQKGRGEHLQQRGLWPRAMKKIAKPRQREYFFVRQK